MRKPHKATPQERAALREYRKKEKQKRDNEPRDDYYITIRSWTEAQLIADMQEVCGFIALLSQKLALTLAEEEKELVAEALEELYCQYWDIDEELEGRQLYRGAYGAPEGTPSREEYYAQHGL